MRHRYANVITWALAIGLLLFAALFAWARSAQLVIATDADVAPEPTITPFDATGPEGLAYGEAVYIANCRNCHTGDGAGRGMYPPVRNLAVHLAADGGREYLIDLVLHGLYTGEYGAPMLPMPRLSDVEIATSTNYVLVAFAQAVGAPRGDRLFTPAEVAARRDLDRNEWEVGATRPDVPTAAMLARENAR